MNLVLPFLGAWLVQNSPANRVPSHGTDDFASAHAIDFVPVEADGRVVPFRFRSLVRAEPLARFPGFGRTILAPATGTILAAVDDEPDHPAYRGLPSVRYALTQRRRADDGWRALAGNHVLLEADGIVVALCHLRQGSVRVRPGESVRVGGALAECGNSGNSTEPHVHVQAFDRADPEAARAVPITFGGGLPRNGTVVIGGA